MDEREMLKNPQAEKWINAKLKGIKEIVDSGKPNAIWISESDWPQGGFDKTYLQKLEEVVPLPGRSEQVSDTSARGVVTKEVLERLGAREWKLNAYFLGWDSREEHIYARTSTPGVYAHRLTWEGGGWGGELVFVSANLDEEKVTSISNIAELKKAWEEKYKTIEKASKGDIPQSILIKDTEIIGLLGTSGDMLRRVFRNIPMWGSFDRSLSEIKDAKDSPPVARTLDLLVKYGLNPQFQGSISSEDAEMSNMELKWFYYATKLPNVFLHKVYYGFKQDKASILPPIVLKSQIFVTVNCAEEQFKLE